MTAFHFIRPEWLLALIPAALLGWLVLRNRASAGAEGWARHIDSHLLRQLAISGGQAKRRPWVPLAGGLMVLATIIGLAGPTWQRAEVPSFDGGAPVVTVLSLAQSMNADDLRPTRLKRAVHKLRDILARTEGDDRALVIYSDAPFVAAPLTNDAQVIEQMLPELSTNLMPVLGNRLDLAIAEAQGVLERADAARGQIVVLADDAGNDPAASIAAARAAHQAGYSVSVLGAGTEEGARLQTADGRAIAGRDGQTYQTALARDDLEKVAQAGGGVFSTITPGSADLNKILPAQTGAQAAGERQDFQADAWMDRGYLLLILPVLLLPFAFRRGLVFGLGLLACGLAQPQGARAGVWDDLWATPNQQGQAAFDARDYGAAAGLFDTPDWQGAASYRAGDYAAAARDFAGEDYNLGNALAKSGQFEAALAAYDAALEMDPEDADAQFNRDLVAELLKQQQKQQQQDQGGQQNQQSQGGEGQQDQKQQEQGGQQNQQSGQDQQQGQDGQPQDQQSGQDQQSASQDGQGQESAQDQNGAEKGDQGQPQDDNGGQSDPAEDGQAGSEDDRPTGQQGSEQAGQKPTEGGQEPGQETQAADAAATDEPQDGKTMAERLADALSGSDQAPQAEASVPGAKPVDQAIEQQLRRVPDDPSGLLRARIRQHYANMGARN